MNEREMLKYAAKAMGGLEYVADVDEWIEVDDKGNRGAWWNPLLDNGDAFRLAVKLSMYLNVYICEQLNQTNVGGSCHHLISEQHNGDPYAATRLAIVRAAAEIGRIMK